MQSRQVVRSWATARMSLIVKEDKNSMKNFIESPSFPELRKQARKTNESKEWSIQDGQPPYQRPYIFNIAQNSKKPPEKMEKVKLLWSFSKTLKNWDSFENASPLRIQQSLNENLSFLNFRSPLISQFSDLESRVESKKTGLFPAGFLFNRSFLYV